MPAKAGIQVHPEHTHRKAWIPACAGMTERKPDGSDILELKQKIFRYYE